MIIQDTEGVELDTGIATIGGSILKIVSTPTGLYAIVAEGSGAPPKLTEERFTNIHLAKRALASYERDTQSTRRKKQIIKEGVERRAVALELKNGALEGTVNGDAESPNK